MAYRVVWSSKAIADVEAIATYIARDSPSYAAAVVRKIIDNTRLLQQCPDKGKPIAEFADHSILEKAAYTYRIIYQIKDDLVIVAAIIHSKTLIDFET
ncbi:MAG: hypothetical protein N5P05_003107 [Chroococcopsis gigantea SAG 12.99]|jgi:toxin ParE1/3/4|nr:type II toxin-antitoxin system RelE/ParE family toxin [Chlorogloea purpurea SAG 13.99]MDV3001501.1 hypothetical protein [Chroococcopsis gigantea SAG 12.99]